MAKLRHFGKHCSVLPMGFYLRKSIKVGPFRFNLSGSGIGVSAGVKGFRIGTGPSGNYVHIGRGGIYYRKTLSPAAGCRSQRHYGLSEKNDQRNEVKGVGPMIDTESGEVTAMTDLSSAELLQELHEKKKKVRLGPVTTIAAIICVLGCFAIQLPLFIQIVIAITAGFGVYSAFRRDVLAKTVVLFYGFDPPQERAYAALHEAAAKLASCAGHWHISGSAHVYEGKYHAGASALVNRKPTLVRRASPPFLRTNLDTVSIGGGRQTLYFFPDRVLVYDTGKIGAIGYEQLQVSVTQTRFIEDSAPSDARVVDQTWRFVNKKGGPDRRFANNQILPICLYDELHFTSQTGLNEIIQASRSGVGDALRDAIGQLNSELLTARALPSNQSRPESAYRIGRNGEDLGALRLSEIKQMLSHGELSLRDYYFDFELNAWTTLDRIKELME